MTPGKAPFPASSRRIRQVSSSAERVWTISGSPVSRAAAICWRKARLLLRPRAVVVVKIQPGLADPDDLGMRRHAHQVVGRSPAGSSATWCGWIPTEHQTGACASASPRTASNCVTRVQMVCRVPTPASAARASTPSMSSPKSGKSRWQWLSTSIRTLTSGLRSPCYPPRIAGKPAPASAAACPVRAARPRPAPQAPAPLSPPPAGPASARWSPA